MRRSRRKDFDYSIDRRWLFTAAGLLFLILITVNCTANLGDFNIRQAPSDANDQDLLFAGADINPQQLPGEPYPLAENDTPLSGEFWADVTDTISAPKATHTSPSNITIDLKDANLLDVLSLLAYKMDVNIIFLGSPSRITLKIENLTPVTTFHLILQKEGLDYLTVGRNYIVAERGRLYGDFNNRMLLTRYNLFYVSAENMEKYIDELGVPVQSLTIDSNQKAIWMQGTPIALGKAREIINSLDIMENASFAEGGSRKIRMPVAYAQGSRAEEELEVLIDLLSILLDGFRDGRTDMDWVTWDHPDPVPYIHMDWESPIINPYDIKMKITRDFANDYSHQIRFLIAEGTPDNIKLVQEMIDRIRDTRSRDVTGSPIPLPNHGGQGGGTVQFIPSTPQSTNLAAYLVTLRAIPAEGGTLTGGGAYTEGSSVTVTATANDGYRFLRWIENGFEVSTGRSYTFNIYENRDLEAVFIRNENANEQVEGVGDSDYQ